MSDLEKYVSDDGQYIIPVCWEVASNVVITGCKNLKEAYEVAKKYIDDIPLTENTEYIDGTYKIDLVEGAEEDSLIACQDYRPRGLYFDNPDNEEE